MTYEKIKNLTPEKFKRLCGVRKETFNQMVQLLERLSPCQDKNWKTF
jgi:hypothetical protein